MTRQPLMLFAGLAALIALGLALCEAQTTRSEAAGAGTPALDAAQVDRWMQVKLKSAQDVFAGLTNGDFTAVENSARRMQVLNVLEQWSARREFIGKSDYQGQLNAFEFATRELVRHAVDGMIARLTFWSRTRKRP